MIDWIMEKAIPVFLLVLMIAVVFLIIWLIPIMINYKENNYDVNKDGEVDLMDLYELREYLLEVGD